MTWPVRQLHETMYQSFDSYLTISAFAESAEMVAVENYIDVGDTLGKPCHPLLNY